MKVMGFCVVREVLTIRVNVVVVDLNSEELEFEGPQAQNSSHITIYGTSTYLTKYSCKQFDTLIRLSSQVVTALVLGLVTHSPVGNLASSNLVSIKNILLFLIILPYRRLSSISSLFSVLTRDLVTFSSNLQFQ